VTSSWAKRGKDGPFAAIGWIRDPMVAARSSVISRPYFRTDLADVVLFCSGFSAASSTDSRS